MAEDAVSETVLAAWKNICRLRNGAAFSVWIYRILSNRCGTMLAAEIKKRNNLERIYRDTEKSYDEGCPAAELQQALDILSDENRQIVLLSVIADLSSKEISELTGLKDSTVRSRLARSLAQMREYLS
jgi:RNA polymerase sigma-70 factor (ECF subfamily)